MTEQLEKNTEELEVDDQINADDLDEDTPELEPWQMEEEPDPDAEGYQVDGKLHQSMKSKLKGRVTDRDDKIAKLEAENEALRMVKPKEDIKVLTRPKAVDYDTDEDHELALSKYDSQLSQETYNRNQAKATTEASQRQAKEQITEAVEDHYVRADKLIKESGIKPENYKKADEKLRRAFDTIRPKEGDLIVDQLIHKLGKGSEKVAYFLGVNKVAQAKAQSLLTSDPSGMSLLVYLGEQKNRLTNPKKPQSNAPGPASTATGDKVVSGKEGKYKKNYDKASSPQDAYNQKKAARAAGVDTSKW